MRKHFTPFEKGFNIQPFHPIHIDGDDAATSAAIAWTHDAREFTTHIGVIGLHQPIMKNTVVNMFLGFV